MATQQECKEKYEKAFDEFIQLLETIDDETPVEGSIEIVPIWWEEMQDARRWLLNLKLKRLKYLLKKYK